MTIDPGTIAIICVAFVIANGGVSFIAAKLANGGKFCSEHSKWSVKLKRLEEERQEDTLQDVIKTAVKEAFEENGK